MAIVNDPRLYSGGAVVFNTNQNIPLYANLMARKQARDDAFGEYVRNLNKGINPAGLRNQERKIFDEKLSAWQKYGMENRDAIQKRINGADMKFHEGYQDLLNLVSESKSEEEKKKPAIEILLDPAKRDRLRIPKDNIEEEMKDPSLITQLHLHDEPLFIKNENGEWERNYNRKPVDYSGVEFNPKPFEQDKYFKQFEDIKKSELPPVVVKDPKTMTQSVTTTSVFKPEDKEIIATRAAMDYLQNPAFRDAIEGLDPKQYNDFFKANYGRDIETSEDLATAFTLKGLQQKTVKSEYKDDTFEKQKVMEGIRQKNRKELVDYREQAKALGDAANDVWIDAYIETLDEEARGGKKAIQIGAGLGYEIPLDPVMAKALVKNGVSPDHLVLTEDGKYVPIFYMYDKEGNLIKKAGDNNSEFPVVSETLSVPISRDQLKLALGAKSVSPTQRSREMLNKQGTKPETIRKSKVYTYKGKTFTQDQIEKAAKKYNVTVEEYLKRTGIQ